MDTQENLIPLQENQVLGNIPKEGFLYTWGMNAQGCLGIKDLKENQNVPRKVVINKKFISVSTGGFFAAAISSDHELFTWGDTKNGRNGQPSNSSIVQIPQKINNLQNITQVSCGNWHCLALNGSGQLYVTGHNKYGACGLIGKEEISGFTLNDQIQNLQISFISAGDGYSLYLDTEKRAYSSGFRLKHGNKEDTHQLQIKKIKSLIEIPIKSISAGFSHGAVVSEANGDVYTWGSGDYHQLGHGNTKSLKIPQKIPNLSGIDHVSCSRGEKNCHTLAISREGKVYSWGSGYKGKLGHAPTWSHEDPADETRPRIVQYLNEKGIRIIKPASGGVHSAVITDNGKLMTFGCPSDGRLGHPQVGRYTFLFKQAIPLEVEGPFENNFLIDASSSYYFMAAIAQN